MQRIIALLFALLSLGLALVILGQKRRAETGRGTLPWRWTEAFALSFAALAIIYFRRPSLLLAPQMFVEDGVIFFRDQWRMGWKSILVPYSGYMHLIPRLAAEFASFFPIAWAPRLYSGVALLAILAAVLKTVSARVAFPFAYGCALAVVLVPNSGEVTAFLTNVHWWGAIVLILVGVSAPPQTRGELTRDLLVVVMVGLSGPWAILLAPLFVARVWRHRTPGTIVTLGLLLMAGVVQQHFNQSRLPAFTQDYLTHHALLSLAGLGYRLGGQLVGYLPNYYWAVVDPVHNNIPIRLWEIAGMVGWTLLLFSIPVSQKYRWTRYAFTYTALAAVAATVFRTDGWEYMLFSLPICQRYVFIPLLLTLWLLLVALDNRGWRRWATVAILAATAFRNADYVRMPPLTDFHWAQYAGKIHPGEAVTIPIYPAGWSVKLDARRS